MGKGMDDVSKLDCMMLGGSRLTVRQLVKLEQVWPRVTKMAGKMEVKA